MRRRLSLVLALAIWLSAMVAGQSLRLAPENDAIFGLGKTHRVRVSVSREEWDVLQTSGNRGQSAQVGGTDFRQPDGRLVHLSSGFRNTFPWVRGDLRLNDVELKDIGLRYKGN